MARKKNIISNEEVKELLREPSGFEKIKFSLKCKNQKQKEYSNSIKNNQITISCGCAGTGKSYVALGTALELLKNPETPYKRLVLMVSPVQVESQSVGYLKGDLQDKLYNFSTTYLSSLADMIGNGNYIKGMEIVKKLQEEGFIEIMTVSFARGINLQNCICICSECQQYEKAPFLTLLTRPTETCKMILEGDLNQTDNKNVRKGREKSGLQHAKDVLSGVPGIGIIEFTKNEIVRNPLITKILELWDPEVYGG